MSPNKIFIYKLLLFRLTVKRLQRLYPYSAWFEPTKAKNNAPGNSTVCKHSSWLMIHHHQWFIIFHKHAWSHFSAASATQIRRYITPNYQSLPIAKVFSLCSPRVHILIILYSRVRELIVNLGEWKSFQTVRVTYKMHPKSALDSAYQCTPNHDPTPRVG